MTGTESLLQLASDLSESVTHVRGGYHLSQAADRMERAAEAIERLAHLEPDAEVIRGQE